MWRCGIKRLSGYVRLRLTPIFITARKSLELSWESSCEKKKNRWFLRRRILNNCRLLFNYIESQPALHMASQPVTSQYDWCGKIRRLYMICIGKPSFLFTSHTWWRSDGDGEALRWRCEVKMWGSSQHIQYQPRMESEFKPVSKDGSDRPLRKKWQQIRNYISRSCYKGCPPPPPLPL